MPHFTSINPQVAQASLTEATSARGFEKVVDRRRAHRARPLPSRPRSGPLLCSECLLFGYSVRTLALYPRFYKILLLDAVPSFYITFELQLSLHMPLHLTHISSFES
jgi:hypothetical protein